jgi:hypothetical protein
VRAVGALGGSADIGSDDGESEAAQSGLAGEPFRRSVAGPDRGRSKSGAHRPDRSVDSTSCDLWTARRTGTDGEELLAPGGEGRRDLDQFLGPNSMLSLVSSTGDSLEFPSHRAIAPVRILWTLPNVRPDYLTGCQPTGDRSRLLSWANASPSSLPGATLGWHRCMMRRLSAPHIRTITYGNTYFGVESWQPPGADLRGVTYGAMTIAAAYT